MLMRHAVLSAGLLVAAAAHANAQAVQLRFTPPVGQVTHYRTVSRMWPSGDTTTAPMLSTLYTTRTIVAMDGANYVVRTVMDSTVTVIPGAGAGQPGMGGDMMRGMTITQHMDPRGRVLSSEVTPPAGLPPMVANMMQRNSSTNDNRSMTVMPEGPISPGYTWTDSMVASASGGRGRPTPAVFTVTYRFERIARVGGARVAIISMNGTQRGGLTGALTGDMALDLAAGRVAHSTSGMTMQSQERGTTVRMRSTMEILP
jgi:hypothetical protein